MSAGKGERASGMSGSVRSDDCEQWQFSGKRCIFPTNCAHQNLFISSVSHLLGHWASLASTAFISVGLDLYPGDSSMKWAPLISTLMVVKFAEKKRVHLLVAVHRKDIVTQILGTDASSLFHSQSIHALTVIITHWINGKMCACTSVFVCAKFVLMGVCDCRFLYEMHQRNTSGVKTNSKVNLPNQT